MENNVISGTKHRRPFRTCCQSAFWQGGHGAGTSTPVSWPSHTLNNEVVPSARPWSSDKFRGQSAAGMPGHAGRERLSQVQETKVAPHTGDQAPRGSAVALVGLPKPHLTIQAWEPGGMAGERASKKLTEREKR